MTRTTRLFAAVLTTLLLAPPVLSKDLAPNFNLRSPEGEILNSETLLKEGPVRT